MSELYRSVYQTPVPAQQFRNPFLYQTGLICQTCHRQQNIVTLACQHLICQQCLNCIDGNEPRCPLCGTCQNLLNSTNSTYPPRDMKLIDSLCSRLARLPTYSHSGFPLTVTARKASVESGDGSDSHSCSKHSQNEQCCDQSSDCCCAECFQKQCCSGIETGTVSLPPSDEAIPSQPAGEIVLCSTHPHKPLQYCCQTCLKVICDICFESEHVSHKIMLLSSGDTHRLISHLAGNLQLSQTIVDDCISRVKMVVEEKDRRANETSATVHSCVQLYVSRLQVLEREFTKEIERVRQVKDDVLTEQIGNLKNIKKSLEDASRIAVYSFRDEGESSQARDRLLKEVSSMQSVMNTVGMVHEDENIGFVHHPEEFKRALSQFGAISSGASSLYTTMNGNGVKTAIVGCLARFSVTIRNCSNQRLYHTEENIEATVQDPKGKQLQVDNLGLLQGIHSLMYQTFIKGFHLISVKLNGKHVRGSPVSVLVRERRNYHNIGPAKYSVGRFGDEDGELCRPWGICCSPQGHIIVADRSNHRIQVFRPDGSFKHAFGTFGRMPGELNKPAGITLNSFNNIVVVDKDNHRIQEFTVEGGFVRTFGRMGSLDGQLHYPWDVACNSEDSVLVSDTRNHRIQLFSSTGSFLHKFDFPKASLHRLPSQPRGVCFAESGDIVVTDFDRHRIMLIQSNFQSALSIGKQGDGCGEFFRPQAVTLDVEGNILVTEGRNHRVQVFKPDGTYIGQFGHTGASLLDGPQGLCVTPQGYVAVVDLNNNRILFF